LLEVFALLCRKRYCEEYIFENQQKKVDFPKVISYFLRQVAGLNEQKQRSGEVKDESNHKPEIRFLVNENYLRLIHLIEQIEY
jgi:hypothetical protein